MNIWTCLFEYLDTIEDHGKGTGKHDKAGGKLVNVRVRLNLWIKAVDLKEIVSGGFYPRTWNLRWPRERGEECQVCEGFQVLAWKERLANYKDGPGFDPEKESEVNLRVRPHPCFSFYFHTFTFRFSLSHFHTFSLTLSLSHFHKNVKLTWG